jgi:signal transduction histidine kinase
MNNKFWIQMVCATLILLPTPVFAATEEEINQGSIDRAKATGSTKPTVEMVMERVDAGVALMNKAGRNAFDQFKGADSEFIYAGTYIWIHSPTTGEMLMHPMKPKLEGKNVNPLRDATGKLLFVEFNRVATEQGSGWVNYMWPKPGEKKPSMKVSFVKIAENNGEKFVVGSGVYDITLDEINKALGK